MNEPDFVRASEHILAELNRSLGAVAEDYDVDILYQSGVLTLEFEEPRNSKIVISPNSPVRQIWISAQATSFKLDWDPESETFRLDSSGESLVTLVGRLVGEDLGISPVVL